MDIRRIQPVLIVGLFGCLLSPDAPRHVSTHASAAEPSAVAITSHPAEPQRLRQTIEADWLRQEIVRKLPAGEPYRPRKKAITTAEDAAGAVDGVKDGTYGFHTNREAGPWWQVDLGQSIPLERIVIYNRCVGKVEGRAALLKVLLSDDGLSWTELYEHDGTPFLGQADKKPLVVPAGERKARQVRIQLPGNEYLHLDEVEIYRPGDPANLALGKVADQSSTSQWSKPAKSASQTPATASETPPGQPYPVADVLRHGALLAKSLREQGVQVHAAERALQEVARAHEALSDDAPASLRRELYLKARWAVRHMAMANPLLDFDDLLFVKRVPGTFTHMSDQYYGWWSRPGGGLFVLEDFRSESPTLRNLTANFPPGSVLRPDLSYDGTRVLFAYCRYDPTLREEPDKLDKKNVPEDAFYHLFEMNLDGTGLRQLTRGKYDDFDGRYLPSGEIVFLSTRRGQHVQCREETNQAAANGQLPDCYVRCGGGPSRPVAVYTLHVLDAGRERLRQISPFEMFEWTPSVDHQGRILYCRWDYVDRYNMPYMSLWSTLPDGTNARAVYGNFTTNPHCFFEARAIPASQKLIFTASGHHAFTGGSLVLLDPNRGTDGQAALERLTPEVMFPESEGWPKTYFANPYPLSEDHYLVAWSDKPLPPGTPRPEWGMPGPPNDTGLYLFDTFGNLNLLYRDPEISSATPIPVRARPKPPRIRSGVEWAGRQEGRMLLLDVYQGLPAVSRGTIRSLRIVGIPAKTHPTMNSPSIGLTRDDPGKFVMGTVPVDADGSAYFSVPSGVSFFLQALDRDGMTVQSMRSAAYVQPGQTTTCVGCHEPRNTSPPNRLAGAMSREPSKITPGPEGSWPLDFVTLVGPVLSTHCLGCHQPGAEGESVDLTAEKAYDTLVDYGSPSLREHVLARYKGGRSVAGACAAQTSPLVDLLKQNHHKVRLTPAGWARLYTWIDTYAQRQGSFGPTQEHNLHQLKHRMAAMLNSE